MAEVHEVLSPYEALCQGVALNPEGIAAQDSRQVLTYSELLARVQALATGLTQQAPDNKRIGLCARNCADNLVAYLAILSAGLVWVPINPKNGRTLNQKLIEKSQLSMVIADCESQSEIPDGSYKVLLLDSKDGNSCQALIEQFMDQQFKPASIGPDDILAIKFTGGSTGEPKGVMQSCSNMMAVMQSLLTVFEFNGDDCNLAVAPLSHGASHYVLPILAVGGRHLLLETPDIASIQQGFSEQGATVSFMPPTLIYKLLDDPNTTSATFPSLRHLTYSAAPMPLPRIQQALDILGRKLSTVYGQTEAPMVISALPPKAMTRPDLQESVGRAGPFCDIAILDKNHNPLPAGQVGEIAARGDIVMSGYLGQPEKTQEVFTKSESHWLLTGDLGYLSDEGYLFIKGRASDVIISGGFNIYPAEVEDALMAIDGIRECVVFSTEDDYWGEKLEAAVCLTEQSRLDQNQIIHQLKEKLGPVKTPKQIYLLQSLPRNPVGKVVRKDVRKVIEKQQVPAEYAR
ncbi:AMP-binding protein [Sansalvadorimonas sp. 2012CJ34-2]|uniref:AMP-binding protein n=1 Tax=Parendozoicomonas callyspongiae TaxID=2942213 RepID=A0ABT0PL00_9GAMM|nr:AMP-binding protein [Sansalvadorimonas sp. 2012CJ34-2]MCL6271921.1 AMP-binding protein [Sansalvadorimonas sp. 2012CJ34-2]